VGLRWAPAKLQPKPALLKITLYRAWANSKRTRFSNPKLHPRNCSYRVDASQHGNFGLPQYVLDFRFFQPGRVIFKGQAVRLFVNAKSPQSIGVGKAAKRLQLLRAQPRLQFVCDFHECHAQIIALQGVVSRCQPRWSTKLCAI